MQGLANKVATRKLKDEWGTKVTSAIKTRLANVGKGHFNVYESKNDVYKHSKLRRLLRRINMTMEDTLRDLTMDSLKDYTNFIENAGAGEVEIKDVKTVKITYVKDDTLSEEELAAANNMATLKRPPPLFMLEVAPTEEKFCINQEEVDAAQKL